MRAWRGSKFRSPGNPVHLLLLGLVRGSAIPTASDDDWRQAIGLAERHGIAPLLHEQLQQAANSELRALPELARTELRAARISELVGEEKRSRSLARALAALARAPSTAPNLGLLRVLLLKGAASARTLYPAPELRPRADLDLLVAPEDRADALARLEADGFRQHDITRGTREDEADWHERTLIHPDDPEQQIDLHFALAQPQRHRLDARRLLDASVLEPAPGAVARDRPQFEPPILPGISLRVLPGISLRVLPDEEAALVCAHSIALHELSAPLIAISDFARLLARVDTSRLVSRAREVRLTRALYVAAALLAKIGPPAFRSSSLFARAGACAPFSFCGARVDPARLDSLLSGLGISLAARRLLDAAAGGYDLARTRQARPGQLWRKALFIDRPLDAVRFAASHARRALRRSLLRRSDPAAPLAERSPLD